MASGSLKTFIKQAPNKSELKKLMAEISHGDDRSMAILTSIMIDNELRDAIQARMVNLKPDERSSLFDGNGPLATFSARIRIGYAMGIYEKRVRDDLNRIREIRNAFAHSRRPLSFNTTELELICLSFNFPKGFTKTYVDQIEKQDIARSYYEATTLFIYVALGVAVNSLKKRRKLKPPVVALSDV